MAGPDVPAAQGPGQDLPEAAGRRLGHGAWSSALSVADFATCLDMGLEPVGYVQGFAAMQWSWYQSYFGPSVQGGLGSGTGYGEYLGTWRCPHGFVGGEHRLYGYNFEQTWLERSWSEAWGKAAGRMMEEAADAGAHGVVGVVDEMRSLVGSRVAEFASRGTAVVVTDGRPPPRPFSTYLSGQRLAKLVEAGFMPVSLVAALSSVQMFGYCITNYQMAGRTNVGWGGGVSGVHDIAQVSAAQHSARALAREHARRQLGADVLHGVSVEVFEQEFGEGDLAVQCILKGTRVRPFKQEPSGELPTPVVRLS
jgi:uncharacterized protein YbjQ (UPF0145 family)